jgi:hypothetical protein
MRVCVLSSLSFYPELVEGKERAGGRGSLLTPKLNIRFNGTKKCRCPSGHLHFILYFLIPLHKGGVRDRFLT